uniref:TPR_MLP1_2 domain-containing protein n=1 Tax=Heterorhabditis bacteriophora TaxID=37862 RepID=A0A1I7WD08_HETBA
MNLMNTKRIVTKVDEILQTIASQASSDVIRSVLRDLSKLAGTNYVENEDFILLDQISRLDACKAELSHYYFLDAEDSEKIVQGTVLIENKLATSTKQMKDLQKQVDDWELKVKKIEKQLKDENKNIKQQLTAEKEKTASLTKEIKEKNKENKKLEIKVNNLSTEKDEYHEKVKQLQKELQTLQKKSNEEQQKAKREIQQLSEAKKHLQAELNNRDVELRGQALQVDEKNSIIKKLRDDLNQERHKTTSASQAVHTAVERAKQSEIVLLQHQLDVGLSLLERAKEDASKNVKEMDDAANNSRARSSTIYRDDVSMYIQSRNEWNSIIDELKILIAKAKTEFGQHMDAIRAGKPLASLPKISVAKPPPPAQILKVAPIAPVEPTKPLPGVIGSRPQPAPIGSNISPKSRAPGSPIQKPVAPQSSPVRHPAPIGTRPNNGNDNGANNGTSVPTVLILLLKYYSYNPMVSTHSQVYGQQTNWMPQDQLQRQQQQFIMSMRVRIWHELFQRSSQAFCYSMPI